MLRMLRLFAILVLLALSGAGCSFVAGPTIRKADCASHRNSAIVDTIGAVGFGLGSLSLAAQALDEYQRDCVDCDTYETILAQAALAMAVPTLVFTVSALAGRDRASTCRDQARSKLAVAGPAPRLGRRDR